MASYRKTGEAFAWRKDEDIDVGDIPEPELHKIMEKYGFADYHGIGDIIGHSKGGYFMIQPPRLRL